MLKLISTGVGNPLIQESELESEFKRLLENQPDNKYLCLLPEDGYRLAQQDLLDGHNGRCFVSKIDYDDLVKWHYVVLGGMAMYVHELEECYIVKSAS